MAAKKKEQQRSYMQVFVPNGNGKKRYTSEQALMYGLDKRGIADSLTMERCENINVKSLPYIETTGTPLRADDSNISNVTKKVLGVYAYNNSLYIVRGGATIELLRITEKLKESQTENNEYITVVDTSETAEVRWENTADEDKKNPARREMAVFPFYNVPHGKMAYEVEPEYYLLIYPDQKYIKVDFSSNDSVSVISEKIVYDGYVKETHKLKISDKKTAEFEMTLSDDGSVTLESDETEDMDMFFEGENINVTFTDVNNDEYTVVGTIEVIGEISNKKDGIFLQSVTGNSAVFKLVAKNRAATIDSNFYVTDYSGTGDILFSENIKTDIASDDIDRTITVSNLSPNKKYYAFFDFNLEQNTDRFELYFTLSDRVIPNKLSVNGMLHDGNGSAIKLDVSREYSVLYTLENNNEFESDKYSIKLGSNPTGESLSPKFQHITVWNSRLFGTRDNVVVCSSAGTPFDWTLDRPEAELESYGLTVGGYDETHSWYSTTQANAQASGNVTAIVAYDGHPVIFKDDYMHQVYNTKNPFRIQDICATGCVSAKSICELDSVLYFASRDGIYRYSGGYPKRISDALGDFVCDDDTCCGAYDGVLYVYNPECSDELIYTYDPSTGLWAAIGVPFDNDSDSGKIYGFASGNNYLYVVGENSEIGYFPKVGSSTSDSWSFETNISLFDSSGDKRVHSLMIVSEGDAPGVEINGTKIAVASDNPDSKVVKTRVLVRGFDGESFKLKLSGKDYCKIHRIDIVYSYSGKRYK